MSVQTTNTFSRLTLAGALDAASGAMAGAMIGNPVGAVGGALFGASTFLAQIPLIKGVNRVFNLGSRQADAAAKTLAQAIRYFGSYAAAWGILALAGFSLTLAHVVTLAIVGIACDLLLALILKCTGIGIPGEVII